MKDWPEWFVFLILCIVAFPVIYTERPEAHSDGVVRPALTMPSTNVSDSKVSNTAASSEPTAPRAQSQPRSTQPARPKLVWPKPVKPVAKQTKPAAKSLAKPLAGARERLTNQAERAAAGAEQVIDRVKKAVTYQVVTVVDGDTIRLANGKTVRLLQIDTPELHGRAECFGALAAEATRRLLAGKRVTLVADPTLDDHDHYGRLLRYVYLDGQNVNLRLVAEGVAAPYFYRGEQGLYAWPLDRRAREARAKARGLWGHCPQAAYTPMRALQSGPVYLAS
jgi:micrococcal nuclease